MTILSKLQRLFTKEKGQKQEKTVANIPVEIQRLIPQVRQQYPQLKGQSDEFVAQIILQARRNFRAKSPTVQQNLEDMTAGELNNIGARLIDTGQWGNAERYLLQAVESSEQEKNDREQTKALIYLGRLCCNRGDFSQALILFQQALVLAEGLANQNLVGNIYSDLGGVYFMRGVFCKRLNISRKAWKLQNKRVTREI